MPSANLATEQAGESLNAVPVEASAMETPSPSAKRAAAEQGEAADPTPGHVTKRPRTGARVKASQALAAEAEELAKMAELAGSRAAQAKVAAEEARRHAEALAQEASSLELQAAEAEKCAKEAKEKAERAELEMTKEGRAQAKAKDVADRRAAAEASRNQKLQEKQEAAASRTAIKNMGDAIKASMVISKRGGMWEVPNGSVSFRNVAFSTFKTLFGKGRCSFTPANFCENDASISVLTKDAASIFGSTKIKGGSMYATFVITKMRATFIPAKGSLVIAYETTEGF
mmetsp:Transcript_104108/g.184859  ORF Transcript_104108/g.184859 Transcript_104108/m.184859 type:complete len:286 (-) Transcript_104108:101-958(-)|eukprot:CAMPEP_0197625336 /NCGR_PEP_ID=MMETSP1338-20131121/4727_1 /TAXON_ID=43686 ORGANISM="Pelagodinium beii, Strain RCC1491" /NCGR_SAMPLE_ID=MMETSP1338 /ASSEMBLY_ACC=CAM_ASM_000754 /LENGTH=285 /DNA_ID=CAMNT_0043195717 /DNA_START=68 /DNA_END=925 /DNA_ORIENTATION=+